MPWTKLLESAPQESFLDDVEKGKGSFAALCRLHGISRKTGYKWYRRVRREGVVAGLRPRTSRARHHGAGFPPWVRQKVARLRRQFRHWGAKKLRCILLRHQPRVTWPCVRTLERWGPRRPRRNRPIPGPLLAARPLEPALRPNDLWTVDFKGCFRTADQHRVEPLTVRDAISCYLLWVGHVPNQSFSALVTAFSTMFRRYGLPKAIRVDNGPPFGGGQGPCGVSRLTVWWLRLGIQPVYGRPGHPQDNAAHEQMHRMLKDEIASPPAALFQTQQRRFRRWRHQYNQVRPHETLRMTVPAKRYHHSKRRFVPWLPPLRYPRHLATRRVSPRGLISWRGRRRFVGKAFDGQVIGLRRQGDHHSILLGSLLLGQLYPHDRAGLRPVGPTYFQSRKGRGLRPLPLHPSPSL